MKPYTPEPRECTTHHVSTVKILPKDRPAHCRYCGHLVLPSGRVSKRKRLEDWPA